MDDVIQELKNIKENFGLKGVRFVDDHFSLNEKWLEEFTTRYIQEIGVPYTCNIRADGLNDEKARLLKFDEPMVLLLGGRDKKLPWDSLAELIRQRIDHVVLFGEAAQKIAVAIGGSRKGHRPYTISHCIGLEDAVQAAAKIAEDGDVVLLSPGGTSFDEFKDFAERGESFRKWVQAL